MPRRSSGPRLWWDKSRERFTIVDGRSNHRTGFGAAEIRQAESALRRYIEDKHKPAQSETPLIADVLAAYAEEHIAHVVSGKHITYDLRHLAKWWGTKNVTDINAHSTRAYIAARGATASARRELAFLNASIGHWKANHAPLMPTPKIKLPPKPTPRQDFMTRSDAPRFLWNKGRNEMPSKPKSARRLLRWEADYCLTCKDGKNWTVTALSFLASEDGKYPVLSVHGSGLGSLLAYLNTLPHTYCDTPAQLTCSSKASRSGKRRTRSA